MRLLTPLLAVSLTVSALAQTGMPPMPQHGGSPSDNVKIEDDNDPYVPSTFTGSFTMDMQNYKDGKPTADAPHVMHFWSSPDKTLMEFQAIPGQGSQMKMLTDLQEKSTYMMMTDGQGNKRAMKSHKKKITYTGDVDATHFTVTKETKVIDGHTCTKVTGTGKEGTWTAWVAKDIDANLSNLMGASPMRGNSPDWKDVKGLPLEMTMTDKDGHTTMVMHITDFQAGSVDPSVFSMDGYQVMEIPSMGQ